MAIPRKTFIEIIKLLEGWGIVPEKSLDVADKICALIEKEDLTEKGTIKKIVPPLPKNRDIWGVRWEDGKLL